MNFQSLKAFPFLQNGDKINLPESILETLITMEVQYPLIFEIVTNQKKTHCGVLEFSADEGSCFIPQWIMNNLQIKEGDMIYIRNIPLEKATFIKFKPEVKFLELSNQRATLEYILRSFSCVTIGDKLHFDYNNNQYILEVMDVKPKKACCIIEADIEVEFDEPEHEVKQSCEPEKMYQSDRLATYLNESKESLQTPNPISNSLSTKWGKISKMAHFQGDGNKLTK